MTAPGNEMSAGTGDHGRFRASRADREQTIEVLKAAFVEDRLTKEELDVRVGEALASRTYAELAAVTADIPTDLTAGLIGGQPQREPARAQDRRPMNNAAKAGICVAIAIAVPAVLTFATGLPLFLMFIPFYLMALLAAGAQILASRHERRSRGELPPGPGHDGRTHERQQPGQAGQGHDPARPGTRPDQTRTYLRIHLSRSGQPRSFRLNALAPHSTWPMPGAV